MTKAKFGIIMIGIWIGGFLVGFSLAMKIMGA